MTPSSAPIMSIERRKVLAAPTARVAAAAVLVLATSTSAGGFAAATRDPTSDMGRKAAAMISGTGWSAYVGLATPGLGICILLAGGIVASWIIGREFTDNTIVGLFGVAASRAAIAQAKVVAYLYWGITVSVVAVTCICLAGIALGLPIGGLPEAWLAMAVSTVCMLISALPVAWIATHWRGYLPGIAATLFVLVGTNLASGFGAGRYIPWAIPTLWASSGSDVPTAMLVIPVAVGTGGAWATCSAWDRLQLGRR